MAKYVGPDGYNYSVDELNSYPTPTTGQKISGALESAGNALVQFGGRNLNGQTQEDRANALASAYDVFGTKSADDAARTAEAGRILNLDPSTFIGAKREVQQAAIQTLERRNNSPEDWNAFTAEYPKTSEYLSNKSNMAVSHDDINNLSYLEQMVSVMGNSYKVNTLSQERASIGNRLLGSVYGLDGLNDDEKKRLDEINNEMRSLQEKLPKSTWSVPGVLAGIAGMAPSVETGLKYGAAGAAAGAGIGSLAGGVGAVPGAVAGLGNGFRIGFAKDFASSASGNLYIDELLKGTDPTDAAKGAAVSGGATALLSSAQIGKWLKLPEAAGVKGLAANVGEQAAIGAGFSASELLGRKVAGGDLTSWGAPDLEQIAEGGINMVPIALAMALPGHGYVALKNLGEQVDKSKTYQRAPDLVAEKINAEVAGTPLENVSIPGRELFDYLQNIAGVDPKEAQAILDRLNVDPKEISEALNTGGDVTVKLGDFEVLPKQHREALLEDVKIGEQENIKSIEEKYTAREEALNNTSEGLHKEIGLDENTFYKEAAGEAKSHSEEVLSKRVQAENSPLFQNKLNKHLEEVKKTIESQFENDPMYRASDAISFDLQLFGKGLKDVKEVAKKYIDGALSEKQKVWVDTIAEQHGFSSGHELVKKIKGNRLKDDAVKTRLEYASEQFKKEELGDRASVDAEASISEANVKTAAFEASALKELSTGAHRGDARETKVADRVARFKDAEAALLVEIQKAKGDTEIKVLKDKLAELKKEQKQEAADTKKWLGMESTSQKLARQAQIGITEALKYAKTTLADKPIKEAIRFEKYMKQAREAARQSEKEYRAGKYEVAAILKNAEMINHAFALEAVRINKEFNKQDKYLKKVGDKKKELFKTEENFNQVGSILERFGLPRKDYVINSKTESLLDWSTRMNELVGSVNIPDWIANETFRKGYKDLTMPELKDVTDALKNIQKAANQEKTSIAVAKGESLDALRLEMIDEMNKIDSTYKPKIDETRFDRFKKGVSNYLYQLHTMSTVVSKLQGWKTFGALEKFWVAPVHERANLESNRINLFKNELEAMWNAYTPKERKAMANDKVFYDELGASTTKMKLLGMAFNLGNEGNSSKLFNTRPFGVESSKPWGRETVMDLLSNNLDKRDWQTVQKTWDLINTLWPDLASFHAEMTGFEPKKVEATPFEITLRNGETVKLDGGYYPLKQDPRASLIAAEREAADSPLYTEQNPAWKATTNTGATKQRTNANYSIDLDPALINKHIVDVIHDLHFRDLVSDYRRMLNNKDFQATVQAKIGPEGLKAFKDYVNTVASGESYRNVGMSAIEGVVDYLRKAGTKAAITFRVGVITQNAANVVLYPKAIEGFGVTDTAIGMVKHGLLNYLPKSALNWKAARQVREEIYNISPYMRDRRKTPDYSLNDIQSNMFQKGSPIAEFGLGLLSASDDLVAVPMWKQAYEKKLGETGDSKQSAYYADSLIKAVNGSGRKYDTSPTMRSSKTTDKIFSSFYGFMNTEFNRWARESGIAAQGIENVPRFVGFVASRMIVFTILSDMLSGKGPGEKDDEASYWAGRVATYPLQLLPVVRDIAPIIINSALGLQSYGYRPSVAFSEFENISTASSKIESYIYGKGKTNEQDVAEALAKTAAYGAGYPDQFNSWFFNAYDYFVNGMDPELQDLMKRRPKKERTN